MTTPYLTAAEATGLFERRELSPVELLDDVLARADAAEPTINAFTEQLRDEAYAAARESEQRFLEGTQRPLEGIPLALKDEQPIAGRLQQDGSLLCRGAVAEITHPVVERIHGAGAVVHARTTTPEFCAAAVTHTALWGVTRNPHNPDFSPGGSSGGSGAALAAGTTVLATGSDIAGSIRIPSAYCGTVGFKPPYARVPGIAPFNADTYCADGPMGRSVADVAALQNVIVGQWRGDQASLRDNPVLAPVAGSLTGTRIALSLTLGAFDPDPIVVANTLAFADALRSAGATVEEVELPWTSDQMSELLWAHFNAIMGASVESLIDGDPERAAQLMPYTRAFVERAAAPAVGYAEGLLGENAFFLPLGEILDAYDALLCPTLANTGFAADDPCTDTPAMLDAMMTMPFNIVGRVPVLSVPSGRASNGLPTGVQIVGRPYDDATVFRIGAAAEAELALWTSPDWWPSR
ncbi:amidase [Leucobacter celer]|jgi:aspartyl-tRNA(Asn)/glutamyl-tRNA(Gln) amidotransferase subunit A|uniref:amidase n=1 Tax=Leucobacter celer TaxID=668625 RepID=UPI0006A770A4|nr:amidase [Leucobacter celer]